MRHPILLIAGPSASGKSTLAARVAEAAGANLLSLDSYWKPRAPRLMASVSGRLVRNFEHPDSYDGARLAADIAACASKSPCVAEGFALFKYGEILALTGTRMYLDVPFEVCLLRRIARRPQRPSDQSFQLIGKAETLRTVIPQRDTPGVLILDGLRQLDALVAHVLGAWPPSGVDRAND